jgi:hypothetical protein
MVIEPCPDLRLKRRAPDALRLAGWLWRFWQMRGAPGKALKLFKWSGGPGRIAVLIGDISVLEGLRGDHERAARLRGAAFGADRWSGSEVVSVLDRLLPNVEETVRGPLSQAEFERLIKEGEAMGTEEAVALALCRET